MKAYVNSLVAGFTKKAYVNSLVAGFTKKVYMHVKVDVIQWAILSCSIT